MEEKELWMNKLKEKLGDYSEPLPASGWEQLEKELMPPVERKIYPYRKWTVAAAAVILLALGSSVSLYFLGTPAADEIRHAKTPALASVPDVLPDAQQPDMTGTTIEPVVRPVVKNRIAKAERNIPQPTANIDEPVIFLSPEEVALSKGDKVRIKDGVFMGVEGTFMRVKNTRDRRVVVKIDGITAVATASIPSALVEKI